MKTFDLRQKQIDKLRDYASASIYASIATHYAVAYATYAAAASASYASYATYAASYATQAAPTYAEEVKAKVERNYCLIEILLNISANFGD